MDLLALASSDVFNLMGGEKNRGLGFSFNGRVLAANQDQAGLGGVVYNFGSTYLNPTSANPLARIFGSGDLGYKAHGVRARF